MKYSKDYCIELAKQIEHNRHMLCSWKFAYYDRECNLYVFQCGNNSKGYIQMAVKEDNMQIDIVNRMVYHGLTDIAEGL